MTLNFSKLALALAGATAITLAGCGGGSSPQTPAASAAVINGTAAAGLPLIGTVTVKDATGATKTVTIGDNGSYSVDVAGMTAPFMFRAQGTAGGASYTIHSGATAADVNGNINITPLTDLVIANIAGDLAANYFNGGSFSGLTPSEMNAETQALKAKLLPVLQAMGVDASIDLLRSQFTPLSSALDKALDVISVSVDPDTHQATITNLVNNISITDDIATKAAAEPAPTPLDASGTAPTASDDVNAVKAALQSFAQAFANGLPTPTALEATLHGGAGANVADAAQLPFRTDDKNATQFATMLASDGSLVGMTITDVVIHRMDYTSTDNLANVFPRAFVGFSIKDHNGVFLTRVKNIQVAKGSDGVWRLRGDGRRLEIDGHIHVVKDAVNNCHSTGVEFDISDFNTTNNGGTVSYVMVTGPGLPDGGLKYMPGPAPGEYWRMANIANQNGNRFYVMASTCGTNTAGLSDAAITAIPAKAEYVLTAYRANDTVAQAGSPTSAISYKEVIPLRPLSIAEAQAASFPSITAPTSTALSSYTGGDLTITGTGFNPATYAWIYLGITGSSSFQSDDRDVAANASGAISHTFNLNPTPDTYRREIRVETMDATTQRPLMTTMWLQSAPL